MHLQSEKIPLSLYIHFPWCIRKCPYCDFNSHTLQNDLPEQNYIQALIRDFTYEKQRIADNRPLSSIFMGGGTPSLFSSQSLQTLLKEINEQIHFTDDIEITLEANPGTIEHDDFEGYYAAGINRISLGAQSFNNNHLKLIGRIHHNNHTIIAAEKIKQAGFKNFNLDLMFALPNQTIDQAMHDLNQAISLAPSHLSMYQFTLEPNTYFSKYPPKLPDGETAFNIQQMLITKAAQNNYDRYEVSAYSLPGKSCRHNTNYWEFGDYIGIGAGAHGKITYHDKIMRIQKIKHPTHYLTKSINPDSINITRKIHEKDIPFELMMNVLRLKQGISLATASDHSGLEISYLQKTLAPLAKRQLIEINDTGFRCTEKGYLFLDSVLQHFFPQQ